MALVNGKSYRFKSSNGQYLNVLTDGTPTNGTNVTTYSLDASDMAQVWEYTYYSSSATGTSGHILKCAKNPALCLDRYRASSNLNDADVYRIGTTTADLNDQYVTVTQKSGNNYTIKLTNNNLFLTTTSTATYDGYNVNWQTETGGTNQLWTAEEYGGSGGDSKTLNFPLTDTVNQWYIGYNDVVRQSGCALCCGVMVSKFYGSSSNNSVEYFYNHYWSNEYGYSWLSPDATMTEGTYSLSVIKTQIDNGNPVIIHAVNTENSARQHWVVAYGYTNGAATSSDILVADPYNSDYNSQYGAFRTLTDAMARFAPYSFGRIKLTQKK